jgi:PAS domain S-box-containing protein
MKKISLTLKITIAFISVSMGVLAFLYVVFSTMFQERMLQSEREKAILIAKNLSPDIYAISKFSYMLGGDMQQIIDVCENTIKLYDLYSLHVTIKDKVVFSKSQKTESVESIRIQYPVRANESNDEIGMIQVYYKLDNFNQAFSEIKTKIFDYLALLAIVFLAFALVTRRLLSPLGQIAKKVKKYQLGTEIEFSSIRTEPETGAIVDAFKKMLANIREYTILLERYKYAVDESAIVSKTDPHGKITYVNDEFYRTSGYTEEEVLGQSHNLIRHPDMHKETFSNLWKTLHEQQVWKGVIKNRSKNGMPYYLKEVIVPIFDEEGNTVEYMGIGHDITQIIRQQEQIARQTTDLITGLPNRIKLEEDIKSLNSPKFALVALDNFNMINDYYGYDIGNHTLKETAEMLQGYIDDKKVKIYGLSTGQFGLLVGENVDVTIFHEICGDVLQKIDDYIVHIEDDSFNIHATAGLTFTQENALTNASLALNHAISTRKNSLVYEETENLIEQYENNLIWTKRLKAALADDRIVVYVQPIVDAKTLSTNKYECLVRMIDEDGKVISPYFFLEIAKKSKLYHSLTKAVITSAFDVFSKLPDASFSINFSVEDLMHVETIEFLKEKMDEHNMASRVVLEIVESEGIENFNEIIPLISELKALGCKVAIDDFGTGYSNFAYLMQLDVDFIKIDGSLIKHIDHDPNSQIISHTIMDFAKQLEIETVAEFIHNEEVMKYTQDMGIDYLQGFHLGEPEPIERLLEKIK